MSGNLDDVLQKLEAAVADWTAELAATGAVDAGASGNPAPSQPPAGSAGAPAGGSGAGPSPAAERAVSEGWAAVKAGFEALQHTLEQSIGSSKALAGRLAAIEESVDGFRTDLAALRGRWEADTGAAPHDAAQAGDSDVSERLAHALRDRDEAHQEIVRLRAELEALRGGRAPAGQAAAAPPAPEGPPLEVFDEQGNRRRMGEVLVDAEIITRDQL
ncbi:MAG: hypothetical protein JXR94_13295, partial [Candidatus Hydrogenedentes bacterium]|nr:hypothetical protein [Candidatus Hydrogenedentota bacterium]